MTSQGQNNRSIQAIQEVQRGGCWSLKSTDGYWGEMRRMVQGKIGCSQNDEEYNRGKKNED